MTGRRSCIRMASTFSGARVDQQPATVFPTHPPPRRGSFQENPVVLHVNQPTGATPSRNSVRLDDEDDQTIKVINLDATGVNGTQNTVSNPTELDEDSMLTDDDRGFTKSASASRRQSSTPSISHVASTVPQLSSSSEDSLKDAAQNAYQLPADPSARSGKLRNKYVMSDGTVVNGKGLGRGRPGIKRGPRKSALSNEITGSPDIEFVTPFTPSPTAQAISVPAKRKRADSSQSKVKIEVDDFSQSSRESTPEYNPIASTQTRSGRQSQKPAPIIVPAPTSAKVASKRPSLPQLVPSPSIKKHPKIKAKVYRGREQFALCEHCLRGNGPPGNVIVFCDACNKCWHQRCHDPKISKELVADTTAEWFCSDCDRILHGKKKNKVPTKPTPQAAPSAAPSTVQNAISNNDHISKPIPTSTPRPRYGLPYIPGMVLTPAQRKQYLDSLSKDRLIEIVLRAADLAPNMPIFETPLHEPPQSSFFSQPNQFPFATLPKSMRPPNLPGPQQAPEPMPQPRQTPPQQPINLPPEVRPPILTTIPSTIPVYSHPTAGTPSKPNTAPPPAFNADDDEGYYDDYDELALVYPKPGQGIYDLVLPPESKDLGMMLEGPDSRTFSHWMKGRGEIRRVVDGVRG